MSNSPVYDGFSDPPPTLPLGVPIADRVSVRKVDRRTADRMYSEHHSYLPTGRCGWHYGVYFDESIVGAISFDNWPSIGSIRGHESDTIREVSRVCIAHDTPNLASCAMARAQDTFLDDHGDGVKLLVTYIREDFEGSMFAALAGKGWEFEGWSEGRPPGNREVREIHNYDKKRWVCDV